MWFCGGGGRMNLFSRLYPTLRKPTKVVFEFISQHPEYSVAKWAKFFGVSRSGYYAYISIKEQRSHEAKALMEEIREIFEASKGTYGPERICGALRKKGKTASYRRMSRLMASMGLYSSYNDHVTRSTTDSRKARNDEAHPNHVKGKEFEKPLQALCSDITYIRHVQGWMYLCVVKDIVTGRVVGYATSKRLKKELVVRAFLNAKARNNIPRGAYFHSDRGSQYTSKKFKKTLKSYGIIQSFSRVGMPGDNSWAESFFATFKKECVHHRQFNSIEEAEGVIFEWIEMFYNTKRIQKRLGYFSPREYELSLLQEEMTGVA
jgi:putative transposase